MIQFNLLPDVKLDYIKAQRARRLVMSVAIITSLAAIGLLVLLLSVDALQKKHLSDLSKDISSESTTLQQKPDINTILTVQNQLESLTGLHNGKPAATRLFGYLNQVTPANVSITNFSIDFTQNTVTITGTAKALSDVSQYVDTLKLTTYTATKPKQDPTTGTPFSDVVLSSFSLNTAATQGANAQPANYTITFTYDKTIFDNTQTVVLTVPQVTTRAQLQSPSDLFTSPVTVTGGKQ